MSKSKSKRLPAGTQLSNDSFSGRISGSDDIFLRLSRLKPEEFHFLDKILGEWLDKTFQILPSDDIPVDIKKFQMLESTNNLALQLLLHNP